MEWVSTVDITKKLGITLLLVNDGKLQRITSGYAEGWRSKRKSGEKGRRAKFQVALFQSIVRSTIALGLTAKLEIVRLRDAVIRLRHN
jgi:hypothetical protein